MALFSIISGMLLIVLGLIGYFGLDSKSITALIPAFIGFPLLILGIVALKEQYIKHAMHGAAVLMLLGLIGTGVRALPKAFSGEMSNAVIVQLIMFVICLVFIIAAIMSFINARKRRTV
ncbi:MAG: hypothetical protein ACM3O3_09105 [Syntrophothermus sp.]